MSAQTKAEFLFELGCEELPAGPLVEMAKSLHAGITRGLNDKGLVFDDSQWYATPRRLALRVSGLTTVAPDTQQEILGPPASAARDAEGNWSPAAQGFARKQGLAPEDLSIVDTEKGPRIGLVKNEPGARADLVLPEIIATSVAAIPVAKRMRWGRGRDEFLRPVQWLVALLDEQVIPLTLFNLEAGRDTRGHRFHHPDTVSLTNATDYLDALKNAYVIADFNLRKAAIEEQVTALATKAGATAVIADDLLHEVTGLVEWPVALQGSFDDEFLQIPPEALISSMKEHQKYFHLTDDKGSLLPLFITIANLESNNPATVIQGNEKVIRPRLSDAAFFFNNDKQTPLADRRDKLSGVVFQNKLGTLADKSQRIERLAAWLATALQADEALTRRAAQLAKCDLVSEMVVEFPELQGIAGAHYARSDGEAAEVAQAVEQHYWPRFAGDLLPESPEAMAVALADRLDTMAGIFGIGQTPTGSKDPFGLRRASVAVIRMLITLDANLDLKTLAQEAVAGYPEGVLEADAAQAVTDYAVERLRAWYQDQHVGVDVLRAVTATGITDPAEIDRRIQALVDFAGTDTAEALAAANKRVANILSKSQDDATVEGTIDDSALIEPEEITLLAALRATEASIGPQMQARDYAGVLKHLAALQTPVNDFFDKVMVNAEDPALRLNRLRLLALLRQQFIQLADIALLTPKSG